MENKLKVWIARDEDGRLWLYPSISLREEGGGILFCNGSITQLDSSYFPSVKWEDEEPTEAYIALAEPQKQTKQEQKIDWEQRRYEIAKEMLPVLYQQSAEIWKCGQSITWEETAVCALVLADALIAKLKEQSE